MYSSRNQIEEFFESGIWLDIKDILNEGMERGFGELTDPKFSDIDSINFARGKIEVLREILSLEEKMIEIREMEVEEQDREEVIGNGEGD